MLTYFTVYVLPGIISSVIVAALAYIASQLWHRFFTSYGGNWEDRIYEVDDINRSHYIKRDQYKISFNPITKKISGSIKRIEPPEQNHREWKLTGCVNKSYIIFSFWSVDNEVKSNGCVYVKHKSDFVYRGYYLEEHEDTTIDKTPIDLIRVGKVQKR